MGQKCIEGLSEYTVVSGLYPLLINRQLNELAHCPIGSRPRYILSPNRAPVLCQFLHLLQKCFIASIPRRGILQQSLSSPGKGNSSSHISLDPPSALDKQWSASSMITLKQQNQQNVNRKVLTIFFRRQSFIFQATPAFHL